EAIQTRSTLVQPLLCLVKRGPFSVAFFGNVGLRTCPLSGPIFPSSNSDRTRRATRKKFFEFFTVPIRNANPRAPCYRAAQLFLAWCERAGYQHLEDIEPITVRPTSKRFNARRRRRRSNSTSRSLLPGLSRLLDGRRLLRPPRASPRP